MKPQAAFSLDIALQPKQLELLRLLEATGKDVATVIGYGGSKGGGKSAAIRRTMLARRLKYPATTGMIFRRVFKDLKGNHIDKLFQEYPQLRAFYRATDHELLLPNASRLIFGYAETQKDVERYFMGPEYMDIFVDQAEQLTEEELKIVKTTNRWPAMAAGQCKLALFFNPGGVGIEYLRRVFHLKQFKHKERASDYAFIQAYGWDNYEWLRGTGIIGEREFYALSNDGRFELFTKESQYGRELDSLPPSLRGGLLLGNFERFKGQYYAGVWDEEKCVLTMDQAERLIQPWWTRWMSQDWGFACEACHLWWASGKISPAEFSIVFGGRTDWPVDVVVCYRELVTNETEEADLAWKIVEMTPPDERRLIKNFWLSPDAWAKRGAANTVADQIGAVLKQNGLPLPEPADNDRVGGWRLMYHGYAQAGRMRGTKENPAHVTAEIAKAGPMLLTTVNCPQVILAVPIGVRDDANPEDIRKTRTVADNVLDAKRYGHKTFLSPRRTAPIEVQAQEEFERHADPTSRAIAMQAFELKHRRHSALQRPRGR